MFAHCDERLLCQLSDRLPARPEGAAGGVLSNNDGCVIARSAEAKPFVKWRTLL